MLPKNFITEFENLSVTTSNLNDVSEKSLIMLERKDTENQQIKKNRCTHCNKKVGLLGFNCICSGNFCASHRHADQHECKSLSDIIKKDREILAKQNIKVIADKLEKI